MTALKQAVLRAAERAPVAKDLLESYRRWRRDRRWAGRGETSAAAWSVFNVELTNKCPFKCVMCARTNNMTREQGLMDFAVFQAIVDEYAEKNPAGAAAEPFWLHHFGESLQHPEFDTFIRYAVSKGVRASLSLNPLLLTPPVARRLLEAGPDTLLISLDGHDDATFEKIRGLPNAYEKSRDHLLAFLELKRELGSKTKVHLSMINFPMNRASIERLRAYWEAMPGLDSFTAKDFKLWNGDAADVNALAEGRADNAARRAAGAKVSCDVPWKRMTVAWDGDVVPCCYDYDKKYVLGHAGPGGTSLDAVWNGERMRALRREFLSGDVTNALCRSCPELYPPA